MSHTTFIGMKAHIIFFVAITMLVKPLWPIAEYVANYDYIVEVLCVNRDRPELNCDGKCYLAQQLAKEQREQDKNPFGEQRSQMEIQHLVYYQPLLAYDMKVPFPEDDSIDPRFQRTLIGLLSTVDIDHPPKQG